MEMLEAEQEDRALAQAIEWIARLVAFDTTSHRSNLALIQDVEAYLDGFGITSTRVSDTRGEKANLFFSVGPHVEGGVILSGHTDVVPVTGQAWSSDPWVVEARDGRLYGRGTADMKSFIAIALSAVPRMLQAGLKRPIHFALSYDEEVGLLGAPAMIDRLRDAIPAPAAVIVGEPTDMKAVDRHKGIIGLRTTVTGHEAHSSQTHLGASAIMAAIPLLAKIDELARRAAAASSPDRDLTPPHTTLTVGLIEGGTAPNILARTCRFIWDIRPAPHDDPEALLAEFEACAAEVEAAMRERFAECAIVTERLSYAPALGARPDGAARSLVAALTGANASEAAAYVAEAGQFQAAGFDAILCGPGSIAQAHQPDEYIELSQVAACVRFVDRLIEALAR